MIRKSAHYFPNIFHSGAETRFPHRLGQSETNVTTEPWSAVEWIADADLTRASFYWDSVPHCRNPPSACQVRGRAIPCSDCAKQRHDIIPNRLALTAQESVSGVTGATAPGQSGDPTQCASTSLAMTELPCAASLRLP